MTAIRIFLLLATVLICLITAIAMYSYGMNWPAVLVTDLQALNWRTQFDVDFLTYLVIFGVWVAWREGLGVKGYGLGLTSMVMGGVFAFPYLLYCTFQSGGDPRRLLLGVQHKESV